MNEAGTEITGTAEIDLFHPLNTKKYGIVPAPDEIASKNLDQTQLKAIEIFDYCSFADEEKRMEPPHRYNYF